MRRFLYILILLASTAIAILIMNTIFTEDEITPDNAILDRVTDEDFDLPAATLDQPAALEVKFPRTEIIIDEEGREREVQTGWFVIDQVNELEGNEVMATGITFEFYDKERYKLRPEERIIAKGKADKAMLFKASESMDFSTYSKIKEEFVLEDNILIETFDPRTGAPSFNLTAQNLIFRENKLDSSGEVVIYKPGLSISGIGLAADIDASSFTLKERIRIKGSDFDLSELTGAPGTEEKPGKSLSTLTVTADGPLDLNMADESQAGTSALGSLQTEVQPLSELEIQNNVVVTREQMKLMCDRLILNFKEGEEGKYEVHSLKGLSVKNRTVLDAQGSEQGASLVLCDSVEYRQTEGVDIFRVRGTPEISKVKLPLFEEEEETEYTITCGDLLKIESPEQVSGVPKRFHVTMTGRVVISDTADPHVPVLEADELRFVVTEKIEPGAEEEGFSIEEFEARGNVAGNLEDLSLQCTVLTYNYIKAPDRVISQLKLTDPEESTIVSDEFSIASPSLDITRHPDTTEIIAHEIYRCKSDIEEMPRLKSFDLLTGEAEAVEEPPSRGKVTMRGRGTLRLLAREEESGPSQSVIITESDGFDIQLMRGEESMLSVTGRQTFSLVTRAGELDSLHLDNGGEIVSPELGFTTAGDALYLAKGEGESFEFETKGSDGSAFVTFTGEGTSDPVKIFGDSVKILSGVRLHLTATDHVDAYVPVSLLEKKEGATGTYRVRCDLLTLDRPEGSEDFTLTGKGNAEISGDTLGLIAKCDRFDYSSGVEILTLQSTEELGTIIRIRSTQAKEVYDEIFSHKVEMNMITSFVKIHRGGKATLHLKDEDRSAFSRVLVDCDDEITLIGNILEFKGPLKVDYQSRDETEARSMSCNRLLVYFEKSPLEAPLSPMDFEEYKTLVEAGDEAPDPEVEEENRVKRIVAQENVVLDFKTYHVTCALLTWNIMKDELLCEGMGGKVLVEVSDNITLQGSTILLHPVSEEIIVLNQ